ncbi:MAG: hypothetical protein ACT4O5_03670 [Gammaproteobacteria bacterium]
MSTILLGGAAAALSACGGGDESMPMPDAAPGTLATTAGVNANLAVVAGEVPIPLVQPAGTSASENPGADQSLFAFLTPQQSSAAAVSPCGSSGTRDVTQATRDVNSPYTDAAMLVTRTSYERCVDSVGPPDDRQGATREWHGVKEYSQASTPQGIVTYLIVGDPPTTQMLEDRYRGTFTGQLHEEENFAVGRSDTLISATFDIDALTRFSRTFDIRFDGRTLASGSYGLGSASAPFHINSRNGRTEFLIEGEYQFQAGQCDPGPANVATMRRLVYDDATNRFVGGMLTFTSMLGTATAVFNADGTVTLMDTQGRTTTIDWPVRMGPWSGNACFQP